MTDQELLKAMEKMLIESEKRMEKVMDQKLEPIKEDLAEVRSGVNTLLDWAEQVGGSIEFPLPKIM
nr:MAG TPA: hypothetical protein [Inoviridae sp.]